MLDSATHQAVTPEMIERFAAAAREKMRLEGGGYRRDHLRALAQRVEVDEREVRIMGSKNELLRTLAAANSAESAANGVPSFIPKWRRGRDSNPRYALTYTPLAGARLQPLGHLSSAEYGV